MNSLFMILKVVCFLLCISFSNSDVCRSPEGYLVCCPGFVWNDKERKCKQCDVGTIGPHWEIVCPYPWYGKQCLSKYQCSKNQYDPADGCIGLEWTDNAATSDKIPQNDATNSWHSVVLKEFAMHTNSSQVKVEPNEIKNDNSLFFSIIFGILVIAVLMCIIYVGKYLCNALIWKRHEHMHDRS